MSQRSNAQVVTYPHSSLAHDAIRHDCTSPSRRTRRGSILSDHYDPQDASPEAIDDALRPKFKPDHDLQPVNVSLSWSDFEELCDKWDAYIENKETTWDTDDIPPADVDSWEKAVRDMDAMIEGAPTSGQLASIFLV